MKKTRRFPTVAGKVFSAAVAVLLFTQCTDEPKMEEPVSEAATIETVSNEEDSPMMSLTIDGVHTVLSSTADCKTCDYVVPEDATVVDGKELGIKPGQAICLDEAYKYGNLRMINLEGDEKNPIVIAYNVKDAETISQ